MTDDHSVCAHLHPERLRRCTLLWGHDELAHSWERYGEDGTVVESFEWLGDGDD
jgi:hypothetical protein